MADLLVRGVDDDLVRALKARAGAHARSAEAELRAILAKALATPRRRSLAEVLAAMPEVGRDEDFERRQSAKAPNQGPRRHLAPLCAASALRLAASMAWKLSRSAAAQTIWAQ